jgi:hypothetical protein
MIIKKKEAIASFFFLTLTSSLFFQIILRLFKFRRFRFRMNAWSFLLVLSNLEDDVAACFAIV